MASSPGEEDILARLRARLREEHGDGGGNSRLGASSAGIALPVVTVNYRSSAAASNMIPPASTPLRGVPPLSSSSSSEHDAAQR